MLLIMMYHHLRNFSFGNDSELWKKHIEWVAENFHIVIPGDPIEDTGKRYVCLTFDDAPLEVFTTVYPLFKALNIKGVVAIPAGCIIDESNVAIDVRLSIAPEVAKIDSDISPLCTWEELQVLANSGHFAFASHGYNHKNLVDDNVDLEEELSMSKEVICRKLNCCVDTFVYPFGKYSQRVQKKTLEYYKYSMRIGNMVNNSWEGDEGVLSRICGHNLKNTKHPLTRLQIAKYRLKRYLKNVAKVCI